MTKYSKKELQQIIEQLYPHSDYKIMTTALMQALAYLPKQDVDKLLNRKVIYIQGNISRRFDRDLIQEMSVIILSIEDLSSEKCIPVILHESAHEILNHHKDPTKMNAIEYIQEEDDAWDKVREWLPKEFDEIINDLEKEGGGSKGQGQKEE